MSKKKTGKNTVKSWTFLIVVIILVSAALGVIYDLLSNVLIADSLRDFLKLTIISAGGGVLLFVLYLIYSFVTEKIHKKHPTWFASQDPNSKK
ncbi:hypothetical protein [Apilactobacillus nanyangensis]|uniref:hypothetical protein n=1 Tax=Apilactobacillus nanyangensis TaxID=2799579 RepID=UPI001943FF1B|nr:hypothetical protein [Apilactobacillus nanyangensis]